MAGMNDHTAQHTYEVSFDGITAGIFNDVRGIGLTLQDLVDVNSEGKQTKNTPGLCNAEDLVLTRAFGKDKSLYNWLDEVRKQGVKKPRSGTIVMKDSEGKALAKFAFEEAWIKQWHGPALSRRAGGSSILEEVAVLSVHDIKWV